ncbi:UNVERIFIED_CONTAM: SAG-related sequence SRS55A [Hammondia hammondi]|eukprot:XP_008886474.1 SAG-related sequence SRS55A [Hammondia hammondi]
MAASRGPVTCPSGSNFVSASLSSIGNQIELKCSGDTTIYPERDNVFCEDSSCTDDEDMSEQTVKWGTKVNVGLEATQEKPTGHTLTLMDHPDTSKTMYFQCRNSKSVAEPELPSRLRAATPQVACTIQVAVYGTRAATSKENEKKCSYDNHQSVNMDANSRTVTFQCPSDAALSPKNFEEAMQGDDCNSTVKLKMVLPSAFLVEGMSATSSTQPTPWSTEEDVPAYTFTVSQLPSSVTNLCYKCIQKTEDQALAKARSARECKFRIAVPSLPTTPPPSPGDDDYEDPPSPDEESDDLEPDDQDDHTHSDDPDEDPDDTHTSAGSSLKSASWLWILALLIMFTTIPNVN